MTAAERARTWRQQRIAKGVCLRCPRSVEDGHTECRTCRVEASASRAGWMRTLRSARAFVGVMELLAENRCVDCEHPKEFFHAWRCKRCRALVTERLPKSA